MTKPDFILKSGRIERATRESAAFDLFYEGTETIMLGNAPIAIPTGVRTEFDPQYVAIIKEKSGLALRGIETKAGVIDADFRDEWKVIMRNPVITTFKVFDSGLIDFESVRVSSAWRPFAIEPGMKIAQFLISRLPFVRIVAEGDAKLIVKSDERKGGFGSTGS